MGKRKPVLIMELIRETLAGREAITYEEWLERSPLA